MADAQDLETEEGIRLVHPGVVTPEWNHSRVEDRIAPVCARRRGRPWPCRVKVYTRCSHVSHQSLGVSHGVRCTVGAIGDRVSNRQRVQPRAARERGRLGCAGGPMNPRGGGVLGRGVHRIGRGPYAGGIVAVAVVVRDIRVRWAKECGNVGQGGRVIAGSKSAAKAVIHRIVERAGLDERQEQGERALVRRPTRGR